MTTADEVLKKVKADEAKEMIREAVLGEGYSKLYLISYDLHLPDQDYKTLYQELKKMGAKPVLESLWAVRLEGYTPKQICKHLLDFIDTDDSLVVTRSSSCASYNPVTELDSL